MIFTSKDLDIMRWAVAIIGSAARTIRCDICGRHWDTVSPCAPCNATRAFPSGRF